MDLKDNFFVHKVIIQKTTSPDFDFDHINIFKKFIGYNI